MDTKTIYWPAFIVALALAFAAFTCWSFMRAAAGVSAVTDPGYYSHGLKYNGTSLELQAAAAMGWQVGSQLEGRRLTVRVEDASQAGVVGCQVFITLLHPELAGQGPLPLTDGGQGRYTIELPAKLPAMSAASLTLTKGQATTHRRLLIALGH